MRSGFARLFSTAAVAGLLWAAALAAAPTAADAQSGGARDWVNPDVIALREEVARLGREVARLQGGVAPATDGGAGAPVGADAYVRLDALETQLRGLTGRLEQLEFDQRRARTETTQRLADLSLRVQTLEQALGGGVDPNAIGLDPNAVGVDPNAVGLDPNAIGADPNGFDPNALDPNPLDPTGNGAATGGDAYGASSGAVAGAEIGQPGRGAPPRALGTLSGPPPSAGGGVDAGQFGGAAVASAGTASAGTASAGGARRSIDGSADAALIEAINALRSGAFDDAEQQLTGFLRQYPGHPREGEAEHWLGETYYVRQRYPEAAQTFLAAVQQHPAGPKAPDSLLRLGMTLAALNQRSEACLTFNQVAERYPNASPSTRRQAQVQAQRNGCR